MMNIVKKIRNNWKKSLVGFCSVTYGIHYLIERKRTSDLFQAYCYEALKYGHEKQIPEAPAKRVTIFLNRIANKERGRFSYDKFVAPLLHLAGLDVRLIFLQTNSEANEYMKELDINDTDCVVVAGGNATLNEVISGLKNRPDSNEFLKRIPVGVIPIGETNSFGKKWFQNHVYSNAKEAEVRLLADSAMSIIRGVVRPADLICVSVNQSNATTAANQNNNDEAAAVTKELELPAWETKKRGAFSLLKQKKIYALSNFSCGIVVETDASVESYWKFWFLKERMNRYFTDRFFRINPLKFHLAYVNKCNGCSKCLNEQRLRNEMNNFLNNTTNTTSSASDGHLLKLFYKKFIQGKVKPIESVELKEQRKKTIAIYTKLIEKSKLSNPECAKINEANLIQSQVIASINEPPESTDDNERDLGIDFVVVKDPEFNPKAMFLADRKSLKEFEIRKLNRKTTKTSNEELDNYFPIEVDGEIYKLENKSNQLSVSVSYVENGLNLFVHDPLKANQIHSNKEARVYLWKQYQNVLKENEIVSLQPFYSLFGRYIN